MTDRKISELVAVTTVEDTDEYVVARAGASNKITGANLKAAAGGGAVAAATKDVNAAELKALSSTGIELVGAPGPGKVIVPLGLFVEVKFGTVAFTDPATSDIAITTTTDPHASNYYFVWEFANASVLIPSPASALFTQPVNAYWYTDAPPVNSPFTAPFFADTPLGLINIGGDLADGDGSARFIVYYAVADLLP